LKPIPNLIKKSLDLCARVFLVSILSFSSLIIPSAFMAQKAQAADQYGYGNQNGRIVKLELSNGVRVNMPLARAINGYHMNSYVPDNTDD
jgi:hypothetical protein